ncbi:hypothetical protein [Microbulbifer sp.]|uniref:hypothetical protein n=1 Tax=Microbulbifer sp. TaxID=1908541 RepID=UPI003F39E3C0
MDQTIMASALGKAVGKRLSTIRKAIIQLTEAAIDTEKRLQALEERVAKGGEQMRYRGLWQPSQSYQAGDVVTHEDCLWHCSADSEVGVRPRRADQFSKMFNPKASER